MPFRFLDERQGELCCALIGHTYPSSDSVHAPDVPVNAEDKEKPP